MKKRSGQIKILVVALICATLFITTACSSNAGGSSLVTIQDKVPLAGQTATATAAETFNNGGSVSTASLENGSVTFNQNLADKGIVGIKADVNGSQKLKVKVSLGSQSVYYDIVTGQMIKVPMQLGNGQYTIELFQNISGSEYQKLYGENINISATDPNQVYLLPNQIVNFEDSKEIPALDASVLQNKNSDADKCQAIYNYVIQNISYDYNKSSQIDSTYIPNVDQVLAQKTGICYDYAAVMASCLREAGIPAKLVMGYRSDSKDYHAWNEVLLNGKWITVDATWDSVLKQNGQSFQMEKDVGLYTTDKVF
jgi:transglutaminase-like putative cysteine protease